MDNSQAPTELGQLLRTDELDHCTTQLQLPFFGRKVKRSPYSRDPSLRLRLCDSSFILPPALK